jgi:hypothetical protein
MGDLYRANAYNAPMNSIPPVEIFTATDKPFLAKDAAGYPAHQDAGAAWPFHLSEVG